MSMGKPPPRRIRSLLMLAIGALFNRFSFLLIDFIDHFRNYTCQFPGILDGHCDGLALLSADRLIRRLSEHYSNYDGRCSNIKIVHIGCR